MRLLLVVLYTLSPHHSAARSAKSVAENMSKLQGDRDFLEKVMSEVAVEVAERGSFTSLSEALQQHWQRKEAMETEILELAMIMHGPP